MDKYFTSLDELTSSQELTKPICCDNIENHIISDGLTTCNKCNNTVSNIIGGPEYSGNVVPHTSSDGSEVPSLLEAVIK